MKELHSTEFDLQLRTRIKHLRNYPQMIPFIGYDWNKSNHKILFLGESHYIPGRELELITGASHQTDWYNNNSFGMYEGLANYLNTRIVVNKADKVKEFGFAKPLSILYNLKKELKNNVYEYASEETIYNFLSFYNYFQRPAFKEGASIINSKVDNEVAYDTLAKVVQIIKPSKIIFVSTKAKNSFNQMFHRNEYNLIFEGIKIDAVPHAGSAWWNRKSPKYGNMTGRQKFINLITNK